MSRAKRENSSSRVDGNKKYLGRRPQVLRPRDTASKCKKHDADRAHLSFRDHIERVRTTELRASPSNARTHSPPQIKQIAASIKRFGSLNPILADTDNRIVAGHGRWHAAKTLGHRFVPESNT